MFMFKLNNTDTRTTIRFEILIANFEYISNFFFSASIVDFEHIFVNWDWTWKLNKMMWYTPEGNTPQLKLGLTRI